MWGRSNPDDRLTVADLTPSQTIGPYFEVLIPRTADPAVLVAASASRRIRVEGSVRDGADNPVPDALVEIWQADPEGRYEDNAGGFARVAVGDRGEFAVDTFVPGAVPGPGASRQAPHLLVGLFARGLLRRLVTRIYFPDQGDLDLDPILALVPAERRPTLVAKPIGPNRYRFDIVLQGGSETVFFDV
jgi:protocatechuate 3,4-dioxygenase alpha subunit